MKNYGDKKYWESRYLSQKGTTFDWFQDYDSIKPLLEKFSINKDARILNIGCGNSELGEKMFEDNYKHIYNIDICENVIEYMKERSKNKNGLYYNVMDVRNMPYKNEIFDLVIDKGTMDTILCGENNFLNIAKTTKEISRVLKTGGIYLILSYAKPEERIWHLKREHLSFDIKVFTIIRKEVKGNNVQYNENYGQNNEYVNEKIHYGYICKKMPEANKNIKNYMNVCNSIEEMIIKNKQIEEDSRKNENIGSKSNNINFNTNIGN